MSKKRQQITMLTVAPAHPPITTNSEMEIMPTGERRTEDSQTEMAQGGRTDPRNIVNSVYIGKQQKKVRS